MEISQEGLDKLREALGLENDIIVRVQKSNRYILWIRVTSLLNGWGGILIVKSPSDNQFEITLVPIPWCFPGTEREPPIRFPDLEAVFTRLQEKLLADTTFLEHVVLDRSA